MKFFNTHIPTEKLADAIDSRLDKSEISEHLSGCSHCTKEFAALERVIGMMNRDAAQNAPESALQFAKNLFRARKQFAPRAATITQKIAAILTFDVSQSAPALGERSAAAAGERQMLFSAGAFDLDVRVRKTETDFNLNGQILGEIGEQSFIKLQGESFEREAVMTETGEFSFKNVSAGKYNLVLNIGETEIVIPELILE